MSTVPDENPASERVGSSASPAPDPGSRSGPSASPPPRTGTPSAPSASGLSSTSPASAPPTDASTREALLRTARQLFAHQGYDATSIRQITREAGANLGAVTYHFGSKQALYHAVLEAVLGPFARRIIAAAEGPRPPLDRASDVVREYFELLAETPDLPFLLIQEMMARREAPTPITSTLRRVTGALGDLVRAGQEDGSIRDGDPLLFALSIVAQPVHMSVAAKVLAQVAGVDPRDPGVRDRLHAHTAAFVQAGLSRRPE